MMLVLRKCAVRTLYRLHLWTWPLDRYPYLWRIPSRFGLWYLRAFIRWWPKPQPREASA